MPIENEAACAEEAAAGEAAAADAARQAMHRSFASLLRRELVCALGCTEPIALAYASALAGRALAGAGARAERMAVRCSGNIIKNVKSVVVPNSGGMKGVEAAAVLGLVGGDPGLALEVLASVGPDDIERARALIKEGFCQVALAEGVPNLYIEVEARGGGHAAGAVLEDHHTNVTSLTLDGSPLPLPGGGEAGREAGGPDGDDEVYSLLSMANICSFAREADLAPVRETLERQIECNMAISEAGLSGHWGSEIGRTVLAARPEDVTTRMRARAAAGSDARMGGCSLPVVINSGSGNQGMTASLPVVEYARYLKAPHDELLRALCVSNLTALHLKRYIGSLSAFCGVVCAAAGAGAAVTYLSGGTDAQIGSTVVNTLANVGGIVCDGAKASCAAKIASSVDAAMLGHTMAMLGEDFQSGDGLVCGDCETSIASMGYVGRVGMRETDVEILNIMIGKTRPQPTCC